MVYSNQMLKNAFIKKKANKSIEKRKIKDFLPPELKFLANLSKIYKPEEHKVK